MEERFISRQTFRFVHVESSNGSPIEAINNQARLRKLVGRELVLALKNHPETPTRAFEEIFQSLPVDIPLSFLFETKERKYDAGDDFNIVDADVLLSYHDGGRYLFVGCGMWVRVGCGLRNCRHPTKSCVEPTQQVG